VNRKRMTVLGGFVLGCGLLAVAPAIAGADDPVLSTPDTASKAAVAAAPADYSASLSGGQEVPGNASPAFAMAEFTLSEDGASLSYSARVFGLANPVAAHLHLGPAGENGPVVVPLSVPDQPGTSGCAAIISGGITQLEPPPAGSSASTPGEEACAAIVPAPLPTTTTSGPTTSTSEDSTSTSEDSTSTSEDTTSSSEATTSTTMHMTAPTTPSASVAFRAEDQACRTLLLPTLISPPTTSTSTTEGTSTSTTEEASTSTSDGPTSTVITVPPPTVITVAPPTTASTGTSTTEPPMVLLASDGVCGFADVSGVITDADLTGPLAGETLADLVTEIEAGNIYINFHTTALPAGEIRGQLITLNPPAVTTTSTTEGATSTSTSGGTTSTSTSGGTTSTSTSEGTTSTSTSEGTTSTSGDSPVEG